MTRRSGGCACGAIRYQVDGEPLVCFICHCTDCQRATGGGPAYDLLFPVEAFALLKGEPRVHWTTAQSGKRVGRYFCGECGTPVFGDIESLPHARDIPVGSLDDPGIFSPTLHMWVKSAPPWHHIDPDLRQFEGNPREGRHLSARSESDR